MPENTGIDEYAINLVEGKQPVYRPIYSLDLMKLGTLKAYIENHLKPSLIWLSNLPIRAYIFFYKQFDNSLYLFVNY